MQGSILLCTDSMGKEINSGVLIMQRGDTDLILCLSTCTDILMHSVPATLWHTGDFNALCSKPGKKKERDTSCLTEMTLLPKPSGDINENSGATYCIFFFLRQTLEMYIVVFLL